MSKYSPGLFIFIAKGVLLRFLEVSIVAEGLLVKTALSSLWVTSYDHDKCMDTMFLPPPPFAT